MSKDKILLFPFFISLILISCNYSGDTIGRFPEFAFNTSTAILEAGIENIYINNSGLKVPLKWKHLDYSNERGYDVLKGKIFYFNLNPEEMYFVTIFSNPQLSNDTLKSSIAIRMVTKGNHWLKYQQLSSFEQNRIQARFHQEIIAFLENYTQTKAIEENFQL